MAFASRPEGRTGLDPLSAFRPRPQARSHPAALLGALAAAALLAGPHPGLANGTAGAQVASAPVAAAPAAAAPATSAPATAAPATATPATSAPATAAPAAPTAPCPSAAAERLFEGALPHLKTRLADREAIRIVAIGSSSTAGAGASRPSNSYPSQLESVLRARFPARAITVINAGVNGQEIPDMLARLDHDVLAHGPDLVIWQFGSNGLMRGVPMAAMERDARDGIARIRATGADVMLMDLQHAPRINAMAERDAVLAMMQRIAMSTGTAIFHRYALMKAWDGALGNRYATTMVDADQLHLNDASYRCLAGALAASLVPAGDALPAPLPMTVAARPQRMSGTAAGPSGPRTPAADWP